MTPEDYFGKTAGVLWHALKQNGPLSIAQLKRVTRMSNAELYGALGWLAREGKILILGSRPLNFKFALKE